MGIIKFRGKQIDIGEWVFGDLIHGVGSKHGRMYILPVTHIYPKGCNELDGWEVIPDTVGQFTGLFDKNGKELYEGDIVMWGHLNDGWSNETPHRKAIVKLFPALHFLAFTKTEFGTPYAFYYDSFAYKETHKYIEIIGNEFDNPELLKGGKE